MAKKRAPPSEFDWSGADTVCSERQDWAVYPSTGHQVVLRYRSPFGLPDQVIPLPIGRAGNLAEAIVRCERRIRDQIVREAEATA